MHQEQAKTATNVLSSPLSLFPWSYRGRAAHTRAASRIGKATETG
ncbi:hypothetical protein ACFZA2_09955 [Microbacterium sp. NPDC007973]